MTVTQRFDGLLRNLALTETQRANGSAAHAGVRSCLNSHYYSTSSPSANSMLVGSWGKSTEVRPPRDVDVLFVMPDGLWGDYQSSIFPQRNGPSTLLQAVKRVLLGTFPYTDLHGDGQVVVVPFERYAVEVVPAFKRTILGLPMTGFKIPNTHDGGRYTNADPEAEAASVRASNDATNGNTRDLIRMAKRWQEECNAPLKSFWIELLAIEFLRGWSNAGKSTVYYDWMVRDFFRFLVGKAGIFASITVPGTLETIGIGSDWKSRAESAQERSEKACEYEAASKDVMAGIEWQKIFGTFIPLA